MGSTKKVKIDSKADKATDAKKTTADKSESKPTKKETAQALEELEAKLEKARQEAESNYDHFLRVSAEFENYKKRSSREMGDFRKFANENLIKHLLPVLDNFELALQSAQNGEHDKNAIVEGIDLILKELLKVMDNYGVKPIEALEKPFDPNFHQAVVQEETADFPDNTVLKEIQKGYLLHDRLLRPSMVVVAKSTADPKDGNKNHKTDSEDDSSPSD